MERQSVIILVEDDSRYFPVDDLLHDDLVIRKGFTYGGTLDVRVGVGLKTLKNLKILRVVL